MPLRDGVDLGRGDAQCLLRFQPLASGDVVVFAPDSGRVDGRTMLGGVAVIEWGTGALIRTRDLRVEVRWEPASGVRTAGAGTRCAVCFGAVAPGETVVVCRCETPVHEECAAVTISCPTCGAPPAEGIA